MAKSKRQVEAIVSAMGVFMSIISSLAELVKKSGGTMENIYRLATPEGSGTLETIARIIIVGSSRIKTEFLRLVSGDRILTIDECDGSQVIAKAKKTFISIDSNFRNWGADEKGPATKKTPVQVYGMKRDGTSSQLFGSIPFDPQKICLTQDQILGFIRKHREWLGANKYGTFFLFRSKECFFVAAVDFYSDGELGVLVGRLGSSSVWHAEYRHRVVVPRLV